MSNLKDICIDCDDPWTLGHWWAETLLYRVRAHTQDDVAKLRAQGIERVEEDVSIAVDPVDEPGPGFWFLKVPEGKTAKNRVHIDVFGDVADLTRRGASVIAELEEWTVMHDPEGNEFCVFPFDSR